MAIDLLLVFPYLESAFLRLVCGEITSDWRSGSMVVSAQLRRSSAIGDCVLQVEWCQAL